MRSSNLFQILNSIHKSVVHLLQNAKYVATSEMIDNNQQFGHRSNKTWNQNS